MGYRKSNIGDRDTRITITKPVVTYDDDGFEVITSNIETSFWGKVTEVKDEGGISAFKRLESRTIQIEADSRTIESVSILDTLTTDRGTESYEVVDKFDSTWKFTSMLIAKHKE